VGSVHLYLLKIDFTDTDLDSITTTSAAQDFRTWNAGFAISCGAPWYPSPDLFPTTNFRLNCTWLTNDGRFPSGISLKLTDFAFPGSQASWAQTMLNEFQTDHDMLCKSPARMMFWKSDDVDNCIPFYMPILGKNDTTGADLDRNQVLHGHVIPKDCEKPPVPWFDDNNFAPPPAPPATTAPPPQPTPENDDPGYIPPVDTGGLRKRGSSAAQLKPFRAFEKRRHMTAKDRRDILRREGDHCVTDLVISEFGDHSALSVCDSPTSWGPDFVSTREGIYCDMCERQVWKLCDRDDEKECFDLSKRSLRAAPSSGINGRSIADDVPPKVFTKISHWK
jgi:hypothetical protein